jgi:Na+-driven multidrug efflux pump
MLLQSTGQNGPASFLSTLRSGLCFIPVVLILSAAFGMQGIAVSQTVSDILTCLITIPFPVRFLRSLPADGGGQAETE